MKLHSIPVYIAYRAGFLVALINTIFLGNYVARELYSDFFNADVIRLNQVSGNLSGVAWPLAISISILILLYSFVRSGASVNTTKLAHDNNSVALSLIFASISILAGFLFSGGFAAGSYESIHLAINSVPASSRLIALSYFFIGFAVVKYLRMGSYREFVIGTIVFSTLVMITTGMRSHVSVLLLTLLVGSGFELTKYAKFIGAAFLLFLVISIIRSGGVSTLEEFYLQIEMLLWAPAFQVDVYFFRSEGARFEDYFLDFIEGGGGFGTLIALDFEKYFQSVNGLYVMSLFPLVSLLTLRGGLFGYLVVAFGLFYFIAVRNSLLSYNSAFLLFLLGFLIGGLKYRLSFNSRNQVSVMNIERVSP